MVHWLHVTPFFWLCREEQEKLNVWVALLNLENMYGTEESLQKVFERAVQYCEPMPVYQQLADIYAKSNKIKVRIWFIWYFTFGTFLHSLEPASRRILTRLLTGVCVCVCRKQKTCIRTWLSASGRRKLCGKVTDPSCCVRDRVMLPGLSSRGHCRVWPIKSVSNSKIYSHSHANDCCAFNHFISSIL